jgi:hypothetical protein
MDIEQSLFRVAQNDYGDTFRNDVLDIYKTYLEMADRISDRRERTNSYFLTINTALIGVVTYLSLSDSSCPILISHLPIAIAGITLSYLWYRIIRSYRDLNSAKFKIIHTIEQKLPLAPYGAEWEAVGRGKNKKLYLPFTHIEIFVPWVFLMLHFYVLLRTIPFKVIFYKLVS